MLTKYLSLHPKNAFTFVCPLFNAKTTMGACTRMRDLAYGGKVFEKRRGCQAAIRCSKCPAAAMLSLYSFDKTWTNDHHGSLEPKEGKLHIRLLEKIERVMMQDKVMEQFGVSDAERALLLTANERIAAQMKTAPGDATERRDFTPTRSVARSKPKEKPAPVSDNKINEAARSGDMAAAINA